MGPPPSLAPHPQQSTFVILMSPEHPRATPGPSDLLFPLPQEYPSIRQPWAHSNPS